MLRGVADVNFLVSALVKPRGVSGRLLDAAFEGQWQLVVSPHLLAELDEVLHRDKFRRWFPATEADQSVIDIKAIAEVLPDVPKPWPAVTRDPKDDYLVALAKSTDVDAIISGDPHLTELTGLVPPVVRPADFLTMIESGR